MIYENCCLKCRGAMVLTRDLEEMTLKCVMCRWTIDASLAKKMLASLHRQSEVAVLVPGRLT